MTRPWIGSAKFLFIPLIVEGTAGYDPPPDDYEALVQRRVFFDPDPLTGDDRSLASYFGSVSYGRAVLDATVASPVTLTDLSTEMNPTTLAIEAQPDAHEFEYVAVVYPPNRRGAGRGMAAPQPMQFDPPRSPNRTKGFCRFGWDLPVGTWAMEMLHITTGLGDFYNVADASPGDFDEMAGAHATHLSTYAKLEVGWLDSDSVPTHSGTGSYTLHAIGDQHPAPSPRVAGVKVQAKGSNRYLIIEARLPSDRWERGFSPDSPNTPGDYQGSSGIPSEGVVVYEFAPEDDHWPKRPSDLTGPWPPLQLRTPTALAVGQKFTHHDSHTKGDGTVDHRSGRGRNRELTVVSAVPGGFVVRVEMDDKPRKRAPDEAGGPAVTSGGPHELDVLVRGKNHKLVHRFFDGKKWSGWINLGGQLAAGPAVTSRGPHDLDVFVRGENDELVHRFFDRNEWSGWINLGGDLASAPAVTSGGPHELDVLVRGKNHKLVHRFFDGKKWSGWINLGGQLAAGPAVTSRGPHDLDVFVRGENDELVHRFFDRNEWSGWINLGGDLASAPAVTSGGPHELDVLVRGKNHKLVHRFFDGKKWSGWINLGGQLAAGPAVTSRGPHDLDVFVRGENDELVHRFFDRNEWSGWINLGGDLA